MTRTIGQVLEQADATVTVLQEPSTDELNIYTLPDRLDDATLARVQDIARSPLPPLPAATDDQFNMAFRALLAVLPRRIDDDTGGELAAEMYYRHLGQLSVGEVQFIMDEAPLRHDWFPTIRECKAIASEWVRDDEAVARKRDARLIASRELAARRSEAQPGKMEIVREVLTQAQVDAMPADMIRIGLGCGALYQDASGKVRPCDGPAA